MKKITRRFLLLASAVFALSLLVSCEDEKTDGPEPFTGPVVAVTFKPKAGKVNKGEKIGLSTTEKDAEIYYEIVTGNASSTLTKDNYATFTHYTKKFEAPEGTVYAIAVKEGVVSEISKAAYVLLTGQSAIPTDVLKTEPENNDVWIGTKESEITYEEPVSDKRIKNLQLVSIGPGADCSTEMTINWHSPVPVNYVEFTTADDTGFANAGKIWVKADLTTGTFTGIDASDSSKKKTKEYYWLNTDKGRFDTTFYVCKAELKNLKPNTDYIYRVGTNESSPKVSDTYKFKTAGTNGGPFSFFWAADLHTPATSSSCVNRIHELIDYSNKKLAKDSLPEISYVLFTGDLVREGAIYQDWVYWDAITELKDCMWATCVGNHDYYWYNGYRNADGDKARVSCRWQLECTAFPDTNRYTKSDGSEVILSPTNYWYLYNRVLFIGVDSMSGETYDPDYPSSISSQMAWFNAVVKENAGKYDYIVAFQHYAYIVDNDTKWGHYTEWSTLYDNAGVDFALGSDSHEYSRTYELKNNRRIGDGEYGTVYVTSPMTEGNSLSAINDVNGDKGNGRCEFYGKGVTAGCYFVVNSNSITLYTIGASGVVYDTKSVGRKKRAWN